MPVPAAAESSAVPEPTAPPAGPPPAVLPPLASDDGRLRLGNDGLAVRGQDFAWLELEGLELTPVRWLLWFLLGGFALAVSLLAFLQNWVRTPTAMLGITAGALLLAYGTRGTNRLRLHRLGREALNFALPGAPEPWQRLVAEANRRVQRRHDEAAAAAAALLHWQAEQEAAAAAAAAPEDSAPIFPGPVS